MNKKESKTILLVKSSANFLALWITSLIMGIPILFLTKYPSPIFFGILLIAGTTLYYFLYQEESKEKPTLHMMDKDLEIKNTIIIYDEIEYFQFVGYKADKKMNIDPLWWTPRTLQLHIRTINGQSIWDSIPNKMRNYEDIKQEIRNVFHSKKVVEKKEKLR